LDGSGRKGGKPDGDPAFFSLRIFYMEDFLERVNIFCIFTHTIQKQYKYIEIQMI